jgi:hypothetical protein
VDKEIVHVAGMIESSDVSVGNVDHIKENFDPRVGRYMRPWNSALPKIISPSEGPRSADNSSPTPSPEVGS